MTVDEKLDYLILSSDRTEAKVDDLTERVVNLENTVDDLKDRVSLLESETRSLREDVTELKRDMAVLKTDVRFLKTDVSLIHEIDQKLLDRTTENTEFFIVDQNRIISIKSDIADFKRFVEDNVVPSVKILQNQHMEMSDKIDMLLGKAELYDQMLIEFHVLKNTVKKLEKKIS